ncbi:MAG: class I SAM-dependent methyltransferase [Metallibacterium scheffleri]|jgi:SAM-dependent methyltransferase|uniref:class I SAM-dependent methyltransferase n=1 Tax=Metallibacterium scheffleri TaxID=993689 RepID=UPI0026EBF8C0|nr:class I SAM-dependent methyltransferase [Metallibacterium scheffleri]MCK9365655.1 class I SAM-dependent methyltransferase [Metallibacterium scheffleri]
MSAAQWDQRYAADDYHYGTAPNAWLISQAWRLPRIGAALALADGEGRNGVWLAQQGLQTTSLDQSAAGLAKAQHLAQQRGVVLRTVQADLADWVWPESTYAVIASIFVHLPDALRRRTHAGITRALRPGGLLILEAFTPAQLACASGGPRDLALLYTEALLREDFAALELLEVLSGEVLLDEGPGHRGPGQVLRLLARRAA